MKRYLSFLVALFTLTVAHGQKDSINREISFGMSMLPPVYPGLNDNSGNIPSLKLDFIRDRPGHYSIPVNINYRFHKNNKGKNNLGFIAAIPVSASSDVTYYALSYGRTIARIIENGTLSLDGDLLLGYLKYNKWARGGMMIYPKFYQGANLLLTGFNLGFTARTKLTERLFLENEVHLLVYYTRGNLYYVDYTCNCRKATPGKRLGMTFSKFLSVNLGYRF